MKKSILTIMLALLTACGGDDDMTETVDFVDLERFMGDWYVIANIPTFIEKGAVNAVESYERLPDGRIKTTFTFRKDSPDGPKKEYNPMGWIKDTTTNAEWRMQFVWPVKMPYLIVDLAEDYSYTVISIPSKSYLWIMARASELPDETYASIISSLTEKGYPVEKIQMVEQSW